MNCPVCNTPELNEDTANCPQCHSDLEVFHLIVRASEQRQKSKKIISALGIFAAVTAIGWASSGIFSGKSNNSTPPELCPEVTAQNSVRSTPADSELISMLTEENETLKSENVSLSAKVNSVKVKPSVKTSVAATTSTESGTIIHTVKKGETLGSISKKYFHTGSKSKQIAADNGLSPKQHLTKGMKLKIQK
jgi:LysM repeat protein